MNDTVLTPMASARWVRSATPGPMPDGPPAQSNRMMWRSSCIPLFYTPAHIPFTAACARWQRSTTHRLGGATMSWKLEGDFYENCSCDAICPCTWSNLAHKATRDDYCRFAL